MYSGYLDYSNIEQFSFDIVIIPMLLLCVCVCVCVWTIRNMWHTFFSEIVFFYVNKKIQIKYLWNTHTHSNNIRE